jgi:uncharacterized protein YaaW (UPF0174 family)
MTKEDFQHMGKHQKIIDKVTYPDQITEDNQQLVNNLVDDTSHGEGDKWKNVEVAERNHWHTRLTKDNMPWHALKAVKVEPYSKKEGS